jgi:hypothetical protein
MRARDLDKAAEDFLREHDPLFHAKNKKKLMEYPYLSRRQSQIRASTEIPGSALSKGQRRVCGQMLECVYYDEE